ncbi:MAG: 50S ribosomal protein L20 [Elusimicrobiaceae bacterium]|jgi:large subunit ribosomal protein L20|nr:50S ribosomal protein L20 [Elusimicrobiaceae bacterium]MBT3955632.1 50S ribosomal protein L20 [Elusimicrobiaceae bacterium]MBT4008746.1 50S ribosomal protein L20 [Elusimicrobiaceae bacterium]MBT4402787.1 50S ribosomal protein L20 [Elusimicrobiaceae bacterium]MBT4439578.1 50S ribosomal protein L20 [Elusimicrobiaceae bacterium]
MRVTYSVPRHKRKKKILKRAKGFYGDKSRRLRMATQQVDKALKASYTGRKDKKSEYRALWITRINGALSAEKTLNYSKFINGLKKAEITLNRKMISEMAIKDPASFKQLVEIAKKSL